MNTSLVNESIDKGLKGGKAGSMAMGLQVCSLMWLRSTVNYQYKHGTKFIDTLKILYKQGGIPRFYRGLSPALLQAPLSRFGDTAMNTGVLHYLNNNSSTKDIPLLGKTFIGSCFAGLWRIQLMPIDTCKTMLQVHGKPGISILREKIKNNGFRVLYNGSLGACSATLVGHFPWFLTYNTLNEYLPVINKEEKKLQFYLRYACIGFCSSFISDTTSNSIRVLKTSKQTSKIQESYIKIAKDIVKKEGISGLLFRGLKTKILTNGLQGVLFRVLWKYFE